MVNFNPLTPCGVRLNALVETSGVAVTFQSTHPVWGETVAKRFCEATGKFQSTHPVWGETLLADIDREVVGISIHSPRVG